VTEIAGGHAGNKPPPEEKAAITVAGESFISDVLKPRFLAETRPTQFNYPIATHDKWHSNKYRFTNCYGFDDLHSYEPEFEAPSARLEYMNRDLFDLSWHRYMGEWFCLF